MLNHEWVYKSHSGIPIGLVRRFDNNGSKEIIPFFKGDRNAFKAGIPPDINNNRPLYGMESIKDISKAVCIVEGEKCARALISLGFQTISWLGGSKAIEKSNWSLLKDIKHIVILPDNDEAGEATIEPLVNILKTLNPYIEISIVRLPDLPHKGDICDYLKKFNFLYRWNEFDSLEPYKKELYKIVKNDLLIYKAPLYIREPREKDTDSSYKKRLQALNFKDFNTIELPKRTPLLYPWLYERSINMIFAERGLGKTYFCLSCAVALAEGSQALSYKATKAIKVLYLDGEMPASLLRERIRGFIGREELINENLFIVTPDIQGDCIMPNMGEPDGLDSIDKIIEDVEPNVIFVDNLSTFIRSGKENEGESWLPVQEWAIRERSAGRSIVFVHHTNKEGGQRGSSRKEDVMDIVIQLKKPENSIGHSDGAHFEIHYSKNRHLFGDITKPVEAKLVDVDGKMKWNFDRTLSNQEKAIDMFRNGSKQKEICEVLNSSKSSVSRWCKEA